jgi:hypothetical protein
MLKWLTTLLLLPFCGNLHAQKWDVSGGAGLSWARLIPVHNSTKQTGYLRYGFMVSSIYLAPELFLNVNEHSKFSFGYLLSSNKTGITFRPEGRGNGTESTFEQFELHIFSVGYWGNRLIAHDRALAGWFAKIGIGYGYNTGAGGSGRGNGSSTGAGNLQLQWQSNYDIMPAFWTPTSTLGFTIGPGSQTPRIGNRLIFSASVTMCWKNIYKDYSVVAYNVLSSKYSAMGTAKYQGMPLVAQVGLNYRLFSFGHDNG